jgi:hypothetical protein
MEVAVTETVPIIGTLKPQVGSVGQTRISDSQDKPR